MHAHQHRTIKLSREKDQRRALLKGMATSLVMAEKVTTTKPKAKAVQPYVERLITKAKAGGLHKRRQVLTAVTTEEATVKLFDDLAKRFSKRNGGYTRIQPAGYRRGDNAAMATISFTEQPAANPAKEEKAASSKQQVEKLKAKASGAKPSVAAGEGREAANAK